MCDDDPKSHTFGLSRSINAIPMDIDTNDCVTDERARDSLSLLLLHVIPINQIAAFIPVWNYVSASTVSFLFERIGIANSRNLLYVNH